MMTPAQLERGSAAFRRGYRDRLVANAPATAEYSPGSFGRADYAEGQQARMAEERHERRPR